MPNVARPWLTVSSYSHVFGLASSDLQFETSFPLTNSTSMLPMALTPNCEKENSLYLKPNITLFNKVTDTDWKNYENYLK